MSSIFNFSSFDIVYFGSTFPWFGWRNKMFSLHYVQFLKLLLSVDMCHNGRSPSLLSIGFIHVVFHRGPPTLPAINRCFQSGSQFKMDHIQLFCYCLFGTLHSCWNYGINSKLLFCRHYSRLLDRWKVISILLFC